MFTGIIETVGRVVRVAPRDGGARLGIETPKPLPKVVLGESIALNGACMTVTKKSKRRFSVDVSPESLRCTTLGGLEVGHRVNVERALQMGDRFGGHIVSGHIDGTGTVTRLARVGPDWLLEIESPEAIVRDVVGKGSVACDGVSLTVTAVEQHRFQVNIIPFTWEHTAFSELHAGALVNVETDMLAKYVRRYFETVGAPAASLTEETLRRAGFIGDSDRMV